uniref:hypothetical protein n=1 Tax=Leptospira kmetyi TaxID=408139 RepID=UPI001FEF16D5|nr:hypothetical protein [Leptospira kmetyi]
MAIQNFKSWNEKIEEEYLKSFKPGSEKVAIKYFIKPLVQKNFHEYFYRSSFLIGYSVSESAISNYLKILHCAMGIEVAFRSKKTVWQKFNWALKNSVLTPLKKISQSVNWLDLEAYRQIRNVIIHSDGVLKDSNVLQSYALRNRNKVNIEDGIFLHIKSPFVTGFMNDMILMHDMLSLVFKDSLKQEITSHNVFNF